VNWELITQGLELSVMGILTTFTALGLFIGTILLLRTVFPTEPRKSKKEADTQTPIVSMESPDDVVVDTDAIAAAISAAIYVQTMLAQAPDDGTMVTMESAFVPQRRRVRRTGIGARLEEPRGRWWQSMPDSKE